MFEDLIEKAKVRTLYALQYSGYTIWWQASRCLQAAMYGVSTAAAKGHALSVQAANNILAARTNLGQEEEVDKDQVVVEATFPEKEQDLSSVDEPLILDEFRKEEKH
jgi:hypothetical protein